MKTIRFVIGMLAAGWLLVPRPGAAQEADRLARARAALSGSAAVSFERVLERARAEGLPLEPLADKVLEGAAKGVPGAQIVVVVQGLAADLGRAQALLRGTAHGAADLEAVSDALRGGVPEPAVRALVRGQAGEHIGLEVLTLSELVEKDVPVDVALDVLGAWRARGRGRSAAELRELPAAVERLIRQGRGPAEAAAAVAASVRGGVGLRNGPPGGSGPPGLLRPLPIGGGPPIPPGAGPPTGKGKGKGSGSSGTL